MAGNGKRCDDIAAKPEYIMIRGNVIQEPMVLRLSHGKVLDMLYPGILLLCFPRREDGGR
jgi:hypothetical protein